MSYPAPPEDQIPWTTARCNRLLRPISSRLAQLRRNIRNATTQLQKHRGEESQPETQGDVAPRSSIDILRSDDKESDKDEPENTHDPDWMPMGRPKPLRRKYSRRPPKSETKDVEYARPGEICMPTPYIARSFSMPVPAPHAWETPLKLGPKGRKFGHAKPRAFFQESSQGIASNTNKQVDGILSAFITLLQTTRLDDVRPLKRGTRSLLSTCLRQVPTYIALEEYWQRVDGDKDDMDISASVYSDLEGLGASEDQGWKPLREVVRSHALFLILEAAREGIIPAEALEALALMCMESSEWDEAERCLEYLLSSQPSLLPPSSPHADLLGTTNCLQMAHDLAVKSYRWEFFYRQLRNMLAKGQLSVNWLATTQMMPIWTKIIRTISAQGQRAYAEAFCLVETVFVLACSAGLGSLPPSPIRSEKDNEDSTNDSHSKSDPNETELVKSEVRSALTNTLFSILTFLSGIALVSHDKTDYTDNAAVHSVLWSLQNITISIFLSYDPMIKRSSKYGFNQGILASYSNRVSLALTSCLTLELHGCQLKSHYARIPLDCWIKNLIEIRTISQSQSKAIRIFSSHNSHLSNLLCSIARCCGRARENDGFDYLQSIVRSFLDLCSPALGHSPSAHRLMRQLALESAMEFAEETQNNSHFGFVQDVENTVRSYNVVPSKLGISSPTKPSPPTPKMARGYRWEEGMSEWVACTPAQVKGARKMRQARTLVATLPTPAASESGDESLHSEASSSSHSNIEANDEITFPESEPVCSISPETSPEPPKRPIENPTILEVPANRTTSVRRTLLSISRSTQRSERKRLRVSFPPSLTRSDSTSSRRSFSQPLAYYPPSHMKPDEKQMALDEEINGQDEDELASASAEQVVVLGSRQPMSQTLPKPQKTLKRMASWPSQTKSNKQAKRALGQARKRPHMYVDDDDDGSCDELSVG